MTWEDRYEGSARQRARRRRLTIIAIIAAVGMILPIVVTAVQAINA